MEKERDNTWLARKGNALGRPRAIKSPQELWDFFCEYADRIINNPFKKNDFIKGGEFAGVIVQVDTIRPFTWQGFEDYLFEKKVAFDIKKYRFNRDGAYDDFSPIITRIGEVIYSNKFEGAAVGAFNHNIIARDLGLVDKTSTSVHVEQPLFPDVSKDDSNK